MNRWQRAAHRAGRGRGRVSRPEWRAFGDSRMVNFLQSFEEEDAAADAVDSGGN